MSLVSIIVTTYIPKSKPYLDLCIESIRNLAFKDYEVIIVTNKNYMPIYDGCQTIAPDKEHFYPAEGINFAMRAASPDSKYFFILNDDVILTKNSLGNLVKVVADLALMANPISPCDNGQNYHLLFGFQKDGVFNTIEAHQYRMEQIGDVAQDLMNADSIYPTGAVWMNFLCIYATLIPRKLYEAVGDWDEKFKCGQDDLDYSWRARDKGFETVAVLDSLVWHFSGVTAESTMTMNNRRENVRYFKEKWGKMPPGIPESFIGE